MVDWLLTDAPSIPLAAVGLIAAFFASASGLVSRTRAKRSRNGVVRVFWNDVSTAAFAWSSAAAITSGGAASGVDGLRMPVLPILELLIGIAAFILVVGRWRGEALAALEARSRGEDGVRRVSGTTWEIGLLVGAGLGLAFYGVAVSHQYGHPIHWLVAGIGVAMGLALGMALATPRYSVRAR